MKPKKYASRLLSVAITALLLPAALTLSVGAEEGLMPISAGEAVTTAGAEAGTQPNNSTSVGGAYVPDRRTAPAVSYGLRVLAAQDEMVMTALCGNEITFTADDIRRAMNLSNLDYVTITELPAAADGTLYVGSVGAGKGQVISAGSLSLLSYAAADDRTPSETTMRIAVNGADYAITCRLCLVDRLNYTPTVALAPTVSLNIETYRDLPTAGTVSAYDPEGDEITFEIVRYASHGRVVMTDKHTGAYTYTPDASYVGKDSFDYVVRDRYGNNSTSATVSIQVSARPASTTFADIDGDASAGAILKVTSLGLMNGTRVGADSYFKPTEAISRVEFLVTALQAAGVTAEDVAALAAPSVADCDAIPAAMRPYVSYALQRSYIGTKALSDKAYFKPNDPISRAEAAVILSNIIGYATEDTVTAFADADALPAWSNQALTSLRALGILSTPDGNANASATMTRANTAEWLAKAIQLMKS